MNSKLRNLKIKPRLTVSRTSIKSQDSEEAAVKQLNEEQTNVVKENEVVNEPERVFSPPAPQVPREQPDTSSVQSIINKFRKPKPTPGLTTARSSQKLQESIDSPKKQYDIQQPSPVPSEPDPVFSPPPVPISASPMRSPMPRSDTPRDFLQSPTYIVNHNVHHPPLVQSPFLPIPHARIRTESLCSNKSIPANLQPRKKFRNEDQKILDNKRESRERLSNKNVEKSQLRMFDMIYYNPSTNPMKQRTTTKDEKSEEKVIDVKPQIFKEPEPKINTSVAVPQLRLNAQGELVLDESSLVVENEEHKKNRILLANTNVVYYDELSSNYGFYKRQKRTKEWSQEETVKFYRCLNAVGTDFSLMLNLFPNRTRRDLKLKFKKEEKNNPGLVDKAILTLNCFDIEELQRELDKEEEEKRKESENGSSEVKEIVKRKILKKQEARAKAQQQRAASKVEKSLSDGDDIINFVDNNKKKDVKENLKESIDTTLKRAPPPAVKRKAKPNIGIGKKIKQNNLEINETQTSPAAIIPIESPSPQHHSIELENFQSSSMDIKIERNDLKKEEKGPMEIIKESILESAAEWMNDGVVMGENESIQPVQDAIAIYQDPSNEYIVYEAADFIPSTSQQTTINEPVINEPQQPEEAEADNVTAFDEESFLNSLNLEKLSIVVRQVNGEDLYDIHETDPETQLISDKPITLPPHLKEMLISCLTQDDD